MEVAQYGDTEIIASDLKETVDKLRHCDKDIAKCKMEIDYEVYKQNERLECCTYFFFRTLRMHLRIENRAQ